MDIRNFCIIAHIDHGKSTLADRLLEHTETVSRREMKNQLLDSMDLERERGITIKLQPVRMKYHYQDTEIILNLIDTPGHVDFSYEVSRSLAAVEGALLLVDATQGVQAQTLANLSLALEQNLTLIPVLNKIDLPSARVDEVRKELTSILGCNEDAIVTVSAKTGSGVATLLEQIVIRIPPPRANAHRHLQALVFDSVYDEYRGVIAYVRLFYGALKKHDQIFFKGTRTKAVAIEVGTFHPSLTAQDGLQGGEIGYIVTGLKEVRDVRVGDTVVLFSQQGEPALDGYKEAQPMVFAGLFCRDGAEFKRLREAVEKLKLNDAAFLFEPEHSPGLGFGFRCGFLGMLHLEIIQERLRREYKLDLIVTTPSVAYKVTTQNQPPHIIHSPLELSGEEHQRSVEEPWVRVNIISPEQSLGALMRVCSEKRGVYVNTEYLTTDALSNRRIILHCEFPLSSILIDFYDSLKSLSAGYASMNYEFLEYRHADVVRLDILVNGEASEELASLVYRDEAALVGRRKTESLKRLLHRVQFEIRLQATVGSKVVASERIAPLRKDVTAKLYGGDVTRKQKLLEKQKKGKKKMKNRGRVDIPASAYLEMLKK